MESIDKVVNLLVLIMIGSGILALICNEIGKLIKGEDIFEKLGILFNAISSLIKSSFSFFKRKN